MAIDRPYAAGSGAGTGIRNRGLPMRLCRPLALFVLTAGLVVLANDLTAVADDVPTKADKKAKRKALLEAKAAEATKAAEAAKATETAKAAKPAGVATPAAPARSAAALTQLIDAQVSRRLAEGKVSPSPLCTDDEF